MRKLGRLNRKKRKRNEGRNRRFFCICCIVVAVGVVISLIWFIPVSSSLDPTVIWEKTTGMRASKEEGGTKLGALIKDDEAVAVTATKSPARGHPGLTTAKFNWKTYDANRTIAFIHIGKAGGLTVRSSTSLVCRRLAGDGKGRKGLEFFNQSEEVIQPCVDKRFPASLTLPRQVKYYFHMHGYRPHQLAQATSYLVVLRHPVDRVISAYRYSHPANCRGELRDGHQLRPYGCHIEQASNTPGTVEYKVHKRCWPSPGMEDFAQAVLSPYPDFNNSHMTNFTPQAIIESPNLCRAIAHRMVRGNGPSRPNPHLMYSYEYYMNKTVLKYPEKEVFGVRTEYEWEDLRALDIGIGGSGAWKQEGRQISHGSKSYWPSPLTTEAYHKLCCVLEREIDNYRELLFRVKNLNATAKHECMEKVRRTCGIGSQSLEEWRKKCQAKIEHDRPVWDHADFRRKKKASLQHPDKILQKYKGTVNMTKPAWLQRNTTTARNKGKGGAHRGQLPTLWLNRTKDPESRKNLELRLKAAGIKVSFAGDEVTRQTKTNKLLDRLSSMGVQADPADKQVENG